MLHRIPMKNRLAAAVFAAIVGTAVWAAPADDLKEAQKLYQQGKLQPALDKIEVYLKAQPKDPQGRFLKGLVLTEQKRIPDAIQVFTGLTEDFPELPEPYNNLAVLYASQGNYDKAKSALELAIHTHPSYATAHENLGDIYAQLASRAYDRALQLDKTNTTAQVKLAMIKDLFSSQKIAAAAAVASTPAKADAPKVEVPKSTPVPPTVVTKVEPKPDVAKPAPPVVETKPAPPKPAPTPAVDDPNKAQPVAALQDWARAWSERDVAGYLAHYAPDFEVPGGAKRDAWEKERKDRIERPKSIEVKIDVTNVKMGDNEATVTFHQTYKSDTLKSSNTKVVKLVHVGDKWLIKQERAGG
ncbi:MAG TPA: tetratricopeptide repeat protein [Usitatibacter sp.]|jgi:tetratricopeptide (TPR) repeat protein